MSKKRLIGILCAALTLMYTATLAITFYFIREINVQGFDDFDYRMVSQVWSIMDKIEFTEDYKLEDCISDVVSFTDSSYPNILALTDVDGNLICRSNSSRLYGVSYSENPSGTFFCIDIQQFITDDNREELLDIFHDEAIEIIIESLSYYEAPDGVHYPVCLTTRSDKTIVFSSYPVSNTADFSSMGYCSLFLCDVYGNNYSYNDKYNDRLNEDFIIELNNTIEHRNEDLEAIRNYTDPNNLGVLGVNPYSLGGGSSDDNSSYHIWHIMIDGEYYLIYTETIRDNFYTLRYSDYTLPGFLSVTAVFILLGTGLMLAVTTVYNKTKQLNETRIAFISGAAHELKTPLAVISNQCECLMENVAPEKHDYYISSIYGEAGRMNDSVVRLLQYSRLSAAPKLVKSDCCISEIIEEEVKSHRALALNKGLFLTSAIEADIHCVCAGDLIALAVGNYLSNAIKYAQEDGEVRISFRTLGDITTLSVYNDGALIEDSEKNKIWEVLYKSDKARTSDGSSTGIGLPTNKLIFNLHGYNYGFKNMDSGVCFWFDIPGTEKK